MQLQLRQFAWVIFIICGGLIFLSNSPNPPNGSTGAPGDNGTCTGCHGGGAQVGSVDISGFPAVIDPGQSYEIKVTINKVSGTATRAGFQLVVLDQLSSAGVSVGTFNNAGPSVGFETNVNTNRTYMEHRSPELAFPSPNCTNCSVTYSATWTAPTGGIDVVHVFASANIANLGGTGGDRIVTTDIQNIPLPIVLTKFYLSRKKDHVEVQWETASEENSKYFDILRSYNGRDYEIIGSVDAAGFSSDLKKYLFVDEKPILNRTGYYKLAQYDYDGLMKYSNIESIEFTNYEQPEVLVFPNPLQAGECIFVEYLATQEKQDINISLFDQNGVQIYYDGSFGKMVVGMNKVIIDSKELKQGLYYLRITSDSENIVTKKVIVM